MEVKGLFIWKTGVQEFEAFDGEKPVWTFTNISGIAQATKTYWYVTNLKKMEAQAQPSGCLQPGNTIIIY